MDLTAPAVKDGGVKLLTPSPTGLPLTKEGEFSSIAPPLKLEEVDLTASAVKDGGVFNNQTPSEAALASLIRHSFVKLKLQSSQISC